VAVEELNEADLRHLRRAIELGREGMRAAAGGPFGAVIVRTGETLAEGFNEVLRNLDPTAHAEIVAIRRACANEEAFSLEGSTLYASCEPCPMCLSAIYWARIDRVVHAAGRDEAAAIGFVDKRLYEELRIEPEERSITTQQALRVEAQKMMLEWVESPWRVDY